MQVVNANAAAEHAVNAVQDAALNQGPGELDDVILLATDHRNM